MSPSDTPPTFDRMYAPEDDAVQRVGAAVMRVGHHQELLLSDGEELPVHSTEHSKGIKLEEAHSL